MRIRNQFNPVRTTRQFCKTESMCTYGGALKWLETGLGVGVDSNTWRAASTVLKKKALVHTRAKKGRETHRLAIICGKTSFLAV